MNKFNLIIIFILFGIVYTRQIGSVANGIFTYESPINSSSITIITIENASSCNPCICAALMSTTDYVAINCYKNNHTCLLFTSLVNITGITVSYNNSLYILSNISIPTSNAENSAKPSAVIASSITDTSMTIGTNVMTTSRTTSFSTTTSIPSTTTTSRTTSSSTTTFSPSTTTTSTSKRTTTTACAFGSFNPFCHF